MPYIECLGMENQEFEDISPITKWKCLIVMSIFGGVAWEKEKHLQKYGDTT